MEPGEPQENGSEGVGNVVRFPRDWFGPPDELVPFGPRASKANPRSTDTHAASLDPNSFWDGSSSSFQDVVEAPAANGSQLGRGYRFGCGTAVLVARARGAGGAAWEAMGAWKAAAVVVVSLLAGLGGVAWLLQGPQPRAGQSAIAAVSTWHTPSSVANAPTLMYRRPVIRPRLRTVRKRHPAASPGRTQTVLIVYHASTPTVPSPAQVAQTTTAVQDSGDNTSSGATEASAAPTQSSPPAFGASGALGPMSSPDG